MATQEEVEEVIKQHRVISLKELKQHYGIVGGSSWIPQRLRALEKKRLITPLRHGNISIYLINDVSDIWTDLEIAVLRGLLRRRPKKKRGRPKGSVEYRDEMIDKLLKFLWEYLKEYKIITRGKIKEKMGWNWETTNKYIDKLVTDEILFEVQRDARSDVKLYTTIWL
jgi:ribosomal protein S25